MKQDWRPMQKKTKAAVRGRRVQVYIPASYVALLNDMPPVNLSGLLQDAIRSRHEQEKAK